MPTTIGNLKSIIATYMGRDTVADLTTGGADNPLLDIGLYGLNAARRKAERLADFRYAEITGAISVASTGTLLSAVTGLGTGSTVKRVKGIDLPIAAGNYIPIEFLTAEEWSDRLRRQIGRVAYSAASTIAALGVSATNPTAYQEGQSIYLVPASQFTFPVSARISVVRFLADYALDADTDFFTQWAPEYLQWQAILECNKFFRRFAPKQEGNIDEEAVKAMADEALQTLLAWNAAIDLDTSTPPAKE